MNILWVSAECATCLVAVDDEGTIREAAPVWRKFVGQPFTNLTRWLNRVSGGVMVEQIRRS